MLLDTQFRFTSMVADLIRFAYSRGFTLSFGDAFRDGRCKYGHPNSLHRLRLAVDFNLFRDGKWMKDTEAHRELGEYWESIGGSWGGRFGDGNHYSIQYKGLL